MDSGRWAPERLRAPERVPTIHEHEPEDDKDDCRDRNRPAKDVPERQCEERQQDADEDHRREQTRQYHQPQKRRLRATRSTQVCSREVGDEPWIEGKQAWARRAPEAKHECRDQRFHSHRDVTLPGDADVLWLTAVCHYQLRRE